MAKKKRPSDFILCLNQGGLLATSGTSGADGGTKMKPGAIKFKLKVWCSFKQS